MQSTTYENEKSCASHAEPPDAVDAHEHTQQMDGEERLWLGKEGHGFASVPLPASAAKLSIRSSFATMYLEATEAHLHQGREEDAVWQLADEAEEQVAGDGVSQQAHCPRQRLGLLCPLLFPVGLVHGWGCVGDASGGRRHSLLRRFMFACV